MVHVLVLLLKVTTYVVGGQRGRTPGSHGCQTRKGPPSVSEGTPSRVNWERCRNAPSVTTMVKVYPVLLQLCERVGEGVTLIVLTTSLVHTTAVLDKK